MELQPTQAEAIQITNQRKRVAEAMHVAGSADAPLITVLGPCSVDMNRTVDGRLAAEQHVLRIATVAKDASNTLLSARYVAEKPRTTTGFSGIIHEAGGAEAYAQGAQHLHHAGVPLASEVMSDAGALAAVPHLTMGWIGAREVSATGPRYAVRPTEKDLDQGNHPLPVWVKNDQQGGLGHTINALHTIMADEPRPRTRIGHSGLETVMTFGNPHVGVILRGQDQRPNGDIQEILAEELGMAREQLDATFGKDTVPIIVDISHAHAKYEGGGEAGQLRIAEALAGLIGISRIDGIMAETYLLPGKQRADGTEPGRSITDPCIGQEKAVALLRAMDQVWVAGDQLAINQPLTV